MLLLGKCVNCIAAKPKAALVLKYKQLLAP